MARYIRAVLGILIVADDKADTIYRITYKE